MHVAALNFKVLLQLLSTVIDAATPFGNDEEKLVALTHPHSEGRSQEAEEALMTTGSLTRRRARTTA